MAQPALWWQKYGTLAQMAQASVALLGFAAILLQVNEIRATNRASSARSVSRLYRSRLQEPEIRPAGLRNHQGRQPRREGPVREFRHLFSICMRGGDRGLRRSTRVAGVLRLRSEAASAVPVRQERSRAGVSRDLRQRHAAMDQDRNEDRQRDAARLQAGKDVKT